MVGAGVAGMQASVDLASSGYHVYLVDRAPAIGGLMTQLDTTFPTDDCQMCLIAPREEEGSGCLKGGVAVGRHPHIDLLAGTEVESLDGEAGAFRAVLRSRPRYIDPDRCTACGDCAQICPVSAVNSFNAGLDRRQAAYLTFPQAVPRVFAIDRDKCNGCSLCAAACPAGAVNYDDQEVRREIEIGAVILAVGNQVFDPRPLLAYGYGTHPNVLTSLEFERLFSGTGPTQGSLRRPSDQAEPRRIAWLQCIGSRDVNTHTYCSSVCCMYALKEVVMAKKRASGDLDAAVFFMDMRTFGRDYEQYYRRVVRDYGVRCIRYRVPALTPAGDGDIRISYRNEAGEEQSEVFNLVVLSVGFEVSPEAQQLAGRLGIDLNRHHYVATAPGSPVAASRPGVFVCGTFQAPKDIPHSVMDASAAAAACRALLPPASRTPALRDAPPATAAPSTAVARLGVFVCTCGDTLSRHLDTAAVRDYAATLPGVVYAVELPFPCFPGGLQEITRIIREKNLNRVVVAGCSPLTHEPVLQKALQDAGLNKYLLAMANIRNLDAWVHPGDREGATRKAQALVRQAAARAAALQPLADLSCPVHPHALVVGGGVAGLTAALNLAEQGYGVYLVEKRPELGGLARRLDRTIDGLEVQPYINDLIRRVQDHGRIELLRDAEVLGHRGSKGDFVTTVAVGPDRSERRLVHGAVILATGGQEYRPAEFLYGRDQRVMTQLELNDLLHRQGQIAASWQRVIMIQCVGSRNDENPNCSRICCQAAVKHALRLKELSPDLDVIVLYRDMRMYGFLEDYYIAARDQGVLFVRFDADRPPRVSAGDGSLRVSFVDNVLQRPVSFPADAVVLSAAARPAATAALADRLQAPRDAYGFFQEAHPKLRPVDGAREGFYLCGLAHSPQLLSEVVVQALAVAGRAGALLANATQPLSPIVCRVQESGCRGCLACVRACPYGVPQMNDRGRSEINPALCRGCGVCAAECPAHTIDQAHYQDEQILAEIEAL